MKPRDLLTLLVVAAVVVIGGFAAADAIRGEPTIERAAPTVQAQTTPSRLPGPQPQADAPAGWPQGLLRGTLTFTDAGSCGVRVIGLAGGRERPSAHFAGDCSLWAPPVGARIAYGLGPSSADGLQPFRIADLNHPNFQLGGYRALFGVVLWSPDGQRVAWCGQQRTGFDLEIGGPSHRLPSCPAAYTPDGEIAYAIGNRLMLGGKAILHAEGGITYATFTANGKAVVVIDGRRLEVLRGEVPVFALDLPFRLQGKTPIVSPDGCAVLFRLARPPVGGVELRDLGCFQGESPQFFQAADAAWSPDGQWVAAAEPDAVVFHHVVGSERDVSWPARAAELAWRPE